MNWITAGFLMFFCSVAAYLLTRRAILSGMPLSVQNFSSFVVPLAMYGVLAFVRDERLSVSPYQLVILVISAVAFSYFGSRLSLASMKYAPNPGYALIISKSYVVFTTLFALIVFGSEFTARSAVAIVCIVVFSSLVMIDPKIQKQRNVRLIWLPLSFGAFVCWGMLAVSSKYLLDIGVSVMTRLIYVMGIVTPLLWMDMKRDGVTLQAITREQRMLFVLIGLLFSGFNYFMQVGYGLAPNIGYINAINAASIAFVTIGASIFFKDEFNARKLIGVFGVIAGLVLLVI